MVPTFLSGLSSICLLGISCVISTQAQQRIHVVPGSKVPTIAVAVALAKAGDVVVVHAGVYREWIKPVASGVKFMAAPNEKVEIKGSEIIRYWKKGDDGWWTVSLPDAFFGGYNPYKELISGDWYFPKTQLHAGEVFSNGIALEEIIKWNCEVKDGYTLIKADFGQLDPNKELTEITVRPACFYPVKNGVNYITVNGFRMSQAATQWAAPTAEQIGIIGTNWSKGWIIENNIISDSKCVGITLGKDRDSGHNSWSEDMSQDGSDIYNAMIKNVAERDWNKVNIGNHIVRNNEIYNCGAAGICGSLGAINSQILNNNVHDVYTRRNFYGAEMAGIKLHGAIDVLIKGNTVNNCFIGLWLDWMAQGTLVSGNTFQNNDYVDFFPEVNHGPYYVNGNVMLSPISLKDWSENGTYTHNLFGGKITRAPQDRKTPYFKPHTTEIIGTKDIRGGGNIFRNNYFLASGPEVTTPLMHGADKPDSLQSYGLNVYRHAAVPIKQSNNKLIPKSAISKLIKTFKNETLKN